MAKLLLAWEFGGGWGHLSALGALAHELVAQGIDVVAALPSTDRVDDFFPVGIPIITAPPFAAPLMAKPPISYAQLLNQHCLRDPKSLANRLAWWRDQIEMLAPDGIVFDSAPIAQLAAMNAKLLRFVFSTGWGHPPAGCPMPGLVKVAPMLLEQEEQRALQRLREVGIELSRLSDFLASDDVMLRCFPELDPYTRIAGDHVGSMIRSSGPDPGPWPPGSPRVYAYLRESDPRTGPFLDGLVRMGASVVVVARGGLDLTAPNLVVHSGPVSLDRIREEADLAVLHSAMGTCANFLCAGTPVFLLPIFTEQRIPAEAMKALLLGDFSLRTPTRTDVQAWVTGLTTSRQTARAARRFAKRHRDHVPGTAVNMAVERIRKRLDGSSR
jgi:UDP:flavonoid glycosyltransferase YjiC (YdhE family)